MKNQDSEVERISMKTVVEGVLKELNLEKGYLYTLKSMLLDPRQAVNEYLYTNRRKLHTKPFSFLILNVAIATFISFYFFDADSLGQTWNLGEIPLFSKANGDKIELLMKEYLSAFQLISIPFVAILTALLFKKQQLNFAEHLVITSFLIATQAFMVLPMLPIILIHQKVGLGILMLLTTLYFFYYITMVFDVSKVEGILKGLVVYLLSNFLYGLFIIIGFYIYFTFFK